MSDSEKPKTDAPPDSKTIDALNTLHVACLTAYEQIRRVKVRFLVRYRYCRLVEQLACMLHCHCCPCKHKHPEHHERDKHSCGHCVPCWTMATLHRIEHLGGEAESKIDDVSVSNDVRPALVLVQGSLQAVYDAAGDVIDAAKKDKPTAKMAGEIQCAADEHLECVAAHLRQIDDMGENYLITLV
jgi:hypothetical protein